VDSRQAEALQLATVHGTVSLAMRNPNDKIDADRDATLLSGGQLASLAEYLGAWVGTDTPEGTQAAPAAQAQPSHKTRLREWDVTIMRGDSVEVQSFKTEDEKAANHLF
jgi:hypothetical protein